MAPQAPHPRARPLLLSSQARLQETGHSCQKLAEDGVPTCQALPTEDWYTPQRGKVQKWFYFIIIQVPLKR